LKKERATTVKTAKETLHNATICICKVGDCGLQTYQIVTILKRATAVEFTAISPILYILC